jgi:hypothetical protein
MGMRPSEPLVRFLRESVDRKGLNTASIATTLGVSRSELKHMLAGTEPLTVDLMIAMAEILELGPEDLTILGTDLPEAPTLLQAVRNPVAITELPPIDPYGNHTEQILRLGFAIGCDMHILLHSEFLEDSNIPEDTLAQFSDLLPIKLDAAFHNHNAPKFLPNCVQITLSFDGLVTAILPWNCFAQITLIPLETELPDIPEPSRHSGSHLRLIE